MYEMDELVFMVIHVISNGCSLKSLETLKRF